MISFFFLFFCGRLVFQRAGLAGAAGQAGNPRAVGERELFFFSIFFFATSLAAVWLV